MEKFAAVDVQRGYKICGTCKVNVFILDNSRDIKEFTTCKTCSSRDVIPLKVFLKDKDES